MNSPKVSIILPVYNGAKIIIKTLDSIISQEFSDFELIVINDGSVDETEETVRHITDKRIKLVNVPENLGIGHGRNLGVDLASGELIAIADADDPWKIDKLSIQVEILNDFPQIDILFSNYEYINYLTAEVSNGFNLTCAGLNLLSTKELSKNVSLILERAVEGQLLSSFIHPPTLIFRKYLINKVGNFKSHLRRASDYEFTLRAAASGFVFAFHRDLTVTRIKTINSVTGNPEVFIPFLLEALDEFEKYCFIEKFPYKNIIDKARHRIMINQIRIFAKGGERKKAVSAFWRSMSYGYPSRLSILYLVAALLGPNFISLIKK